MWRKIVCLLMVLSLASMVSLPALAAEPSPTASPGPSGIRTSSWSEPGCTVWCIEQGLLPEDADLTAPATCAQAVELLGRVDVSGGVAVGVRQGKVLAWRSGLGTLFGIPGFAPDKDITRQELAMVLAKLRLWGREKLDLAQVEGVIVMKSFGAPASIVRLKDPEEIRWMVEKLNAYGAGRRGVFGARQHGLRLCRGCSVEIWAEPVFRSVRRGHPGRLERCRRHLHFPERLLL